MGKIEQSRPTTHIFARNRRTIMLSLLMAKETEEKEEEKAMFSSFVWYSPIHENFVSRHDPANHISSTRHGSDG